MPFDLDKVVIVRIQRNVTITSVIERKSALLGRDVPHSEIEIISLFAFGIVFLGSLSVFVFVSSAVATDIFVCPLVGNIHIGIHLRQLYDNRMRSAPSCIHHYCRGFTLFRSILSALIVAVGIPLGTPICYRPVVPVILAVLFLFGSSKRTSVNVRRHRNDLLKVDSSYAVFIVLYSFHQLIYFLLIALEPEHISYMIRQSHTPPMHSLSTACRLYTSDLSL